MSQSALTVGDTIKVNGAPDLDYLRNNHTYTVNDVYLDAQPAMKKTMMYSLVDHVRVYGGAELPVEAVDSHLNTNEDGELTVVDRAESIDSPDLLESVHYHDELERDVLARGSRYHVRDVEVRGEPVIKTEQMVYDARNTGDRTERIDYFTPREFERTFSGIKTVNSDNPTPLLFDEPQTVTPSVMSDVKSYIFGSGRSDTLNQFDNETILRTGLVRQGMGDPDDLFETEADTGLTRTKTADARDTVTAQPEPTAM